MSNGRPILAARTSSGEIIKDGTPPGPNRPPPGGSRPKRTLIESACSACRRRKSRCDGVRPTCSRCQNLRTECQYEAEEGESRWSALRRRNQVLESERDQLRELMGYVQSRPEHEAQEIFQRIRQCTYEDLFLLLRQVKENAMGMPPSMGAMPMPSGSPSLADQRLPPIQAILDVPGRGMTPSHMPHQPSLGSEESRNSSNDMGNYAQNPQSRAILDTLEPSLRGPPPAPMMQQPTLSSEESTGSMGSAQMAASALTEAQNPQRPYHTP